MNQPQTAPRAVTNATRPQTADTQKPTVLQSPAYTPRVPAPPKNANPHENRHESHKTTQNPVKTLAPNRRMDTIPLWPGPGGGIGRRASLRG